ncbi:polycystic kidney disease protein 1-like [Homalodisca vitripennis]|nr:polycystic kidney disease protein 1-like [Homalodisca vitripennis]
MAGKWICGNPETLAKVIGVSYTNQDFSIAHRLPGRSNSIVAQFISRSRRAEWLAAAKRKRVNTTDLSRSLPPGPVFINEHLTPHNKSVLWMARSLVKEGRLAYAWIKDGKILVRKTPSSKAVQVWFERDVTKAAFPPRLPDESQAEDSQRSAPNNNSSISPTKGQVN